MRYEELCERFEILSNEAKYLEKNDIIIELLKETPPQDMRSMAKLVLGQIYEDIEQKNLDFGEKMCEMALVTASGWAGWEVKGVIKEKGDIGEATEFLIENKRQFNLIPEDLTLNRVFNEMRRIFGDQGEDSRKRKLGRVIGLLSDATPLEAKYIIRTLIGDLRIGIGEGRLKEAIIKFYMVDKKKFNRAFMIRNELGLLMEVLARSESISERNLILDNVRIEVGAPIRSMLAKKGENLDDVIWKIGNPIFEYKYDGMRLQLHKDGDIINLYTRNFQNVTNAFPEVVEEAKKLFCNTCILDGEIIGFDKKSKKPLSFQKVLLRKRKYGIDLKKDEIKVEYHVFDIIFHEKKELISEKLEHRKSTLDTIIGKSEVIKKTRFLITDNFNSIKNFLEESRFCGHEGLIAKDLDSKYLAGKRGNAWMKLKVKAETLDCLVMGAWDGKGKRADFFGSFLLGVLNEDGKIVTIGNVGTGFSDEQFEELYKMIREKSRAGGLIQAKFLKKTMPNEYVSKIEPDVWIIPKFIFEIEYEEIQKSPEEKHTSGYGLRFPRFFALRGDKAVLDVDNLSDVEKLYEAQQKLKGE